MSRNYTKVLLVSANVGSIFEDPDHMLKLWLTEFLSTVKRLDPDFLAIHCQEVGGKNYEESMQHVNLFIKTILAREEMQQFDKARVFLDEDFTAVDKFTALGNLYFIHESLQDVQIWNFEEKSFVSVDGREVLSGNIEAVPIKEKAKFPQEFFPDFKWSRKGFLRTRWNIHNTIFDLINIHLFHDANNIVAMETTPSTYSMNRQRTLLHTINRLENDEFGQYPYFLFGDFNFRLDTKGLVKKLTEGCVAQQSKGKKNDVNKVVFKKKDSEAPLLTIEKKGFDHHNQHDEVFCNNNDQWLLEYDLEPRAFKEKLQEYDVVFPPSYPFSEDVDNGCGYMKTRVPSWCDRIMFTPSCQGILHQSNKEVPEYNMIGSNICMGDHKPIYLNFKLRHNVSGNETGEDIEAACNLPNSSDEPTKTLPLSRRPRLKKVISINGEEVNASSLDDINIHDFTTFEREQYITRKFMSTIRRKNRGRTVSAPPGEYDSVDLSEKEKKPGFRNIARSVMRADNVLRAMKHYSHRSDSESESEDEENGEGEEPTPKGVKSAPPTPCAGNTAAATTLFSVKEICDTGSVGKLRGVVKDDDDGHSSTSPASNAPPDDKTTDNDDKNTNTNNNSVFSPHQVDVVIINDSACPSVAMETENVTKLEKATVTKGRKLGGSVGMDCSCCVVM